MVLMAGRLLARSLIAVSPIFPLNSLVKLFFSMDQTTVLPSTLVALLTPWLSPLRTSRTRATGRATMLESPSIPTTGPPLVLAVLPFLTGPLLLPTISLQSSVPSVTSALRPEAVSMASGPQSTLVAPSLTPLLLPPPLASWP